MKKVFYSYNAAIDFAQSIGIDTHYFEWENRHLGGVLTNLGQSVGFDIDGFSEVLPLIYVEEYDFTDRLGHTEHRKEIRHRGEVLHLIEKDRYYYISNADKGKHSLSSLALINAPYRTFEYWRTELVAPQYIGKATKTKIINWAEYSDALEREKIAYFNRRKERRDNLISSITANSDPSSLQVIKGEEPSEFFEWEFQPIVITYTADNGLQIKWELDAYGGVSRTIGRDYEKAPAFADALDGGEYKK